MDKIKVGILGATGFVGQRFAQLLENHPWFEITVLAASDRSVGKVYEEACLWRLSTLMPERLKNLKVHPVEPKLDCDFVFSSLPSSMAREVEETFAKAGYPVISNSSNFRMVQDVPLLVPEINADHCDIIPLQQKQRNYEKGFIATNPNCTTITLVLGLAPIEQTFGIEKIQSTSLQALSGAGQSGVSSMDIIDNVIPYIGNEEDKVESEPQKIFGSFKDAAIHPADIGISAQCTRVNVSDGHTIAVSVKLGRSPDENEVIDTFSQYTSPLLDMNLPSAPDRPVILLLDADRPQPRLDRNLGNGMVSVVGRIRPCPLLDYKFVILGHNTIRGAAGAAILNAELLKTKGFI